MSDTPSELVKRLREAIKRETPRGAHGFPFVAISADDLRQAADTIERQSEGIFQAELARQAEVARLSAALEEANKRTP